MNTALTAEEVQKLFDDSADVLRSARGWPKEQVLLIVKTDRPAMDGLTRQLREVIAVLLCDASLKTYLGPTMWSMLQTCKQLHILDSAIHT